MSKDELFMNNTQPNNFPFRNPLFNETVVVRALKTIRETVDNVLIVSGSTDIKMFGHKGSEFIRLLVDLKINEITDELTIDRITD